MFFKHLKLGNYRNYKQLSLSLISGANLFIGDNGQGKTNLLEALYLLVRGNSFRPGGVDVLIGQSDAPSPVAQVVGQISRLGLSSEIALSLRDKKKLFSLNQKRCSANQLPMQYPSVLFSPESLSSIKEGPEARRQLVDEVLLTHSPQDFRWVAEFRQALKSRNRILRDHRAGMYSEHQTHELLEALDEIYLPTAAALAASRIRAINAIEPLLQEAVSFISSDRDLVDISVDYSISQESATDWEFPLILEKLRNRLKSLRKSEMEAGTSLVGAHKHDIHILSAGNDARYFCSQGQQRTLILAFKMAQIMYHYRVFQVHPLLLLDDVLSELDAQKGANLLRFLEGIRSQIILTSTDISFPFDFGSKGMAVFRVNSGEVETLRS